MNGERIKFLMDAKGLSYSDLAGMSGVTKPTLQRYATGKTKNIPIDAISRIASALNTNVAYLMGFTNESSPHDSILGITADDNGLYAASALLIEAQKETAVPKGDGLSPLEAQLMEYIRRLTDDQKKMLLAQIELLLSKQESLPDSQE